MILLTLLILMSGCTWMGAVTEAERAGEAAIETIIEDETGIKMPRPCQRPEPPKGIKGKLVSF